MTQSSIVRARASGQVWVMNVHRRQVLYVLFVDRSRSLRGRWLEQRADLPRPPRRDRRRSTASTPGQDQTGATHGQHAAAAVPDGRAASPVVAGPHARMPDSRRRLPGGGRQDRYPVRQRARCRACGRAAVNVAAARPFMEAHRIVPCMTRLGHQGPERQFSGITLHNRPQRSGRLFS